MNRLLLVLSFFLFVACSSDSEEPEVTNPPDEEVVVEEEMEEEEQEMEEEEEAPLFNEINLISDQLTADGNQQIWYEINLRNDGEINVTNLTDLYGFFNPVVFDVQSSNLYTLSSIIGSNDEGTQLRKIVVRNVGNQLSEEFSGYLEIVGAENSPWFQGSGANQSNLFGLHIERDFDNNTENYRLNQVDFPMRQPEIVWSFDDELNTGVELDLGLGFPTTGFAVSDDYLFLSYAQFDSEAPGSVEEKDEHSILVFDTTNFNLKLELTSEEPMGMVHNGKWVCISRDGYLEIFNLEDLTSRRFDNETIAQLNLVGKPNYGFVNETHLIFGLGTTFGNGLDIITVLDFNQNESNSINISSVLQNGLNHIPDSTNPQGDSFTVEFEKERFLIAYSYLLNGSLKYELAFLNFNGEIIDFIELPEGYDPKAIFVN